MPVRPVRRSSRSVLHGQSAASRAQIASRETIWRHGLTNLLRMSRILMWIVPRGTISERVELADQESHSLQELRWLDRHPLKGVDIGVWAGGRLASELFHVEQSVQHNESIAEMAADARTSSFCASLASVSKSANAGGGHMQAVRPAVSPSSRWRRDCAGTRVDSGGAKSNCSTWNNLS